MTTTMDPLDSFVEKMKDESLDYEARHSLFSELRDMLETYHGVKEYRRFLRLTMGLILRQLDEVPVSFDAASAEQKLRHLVLGILQRLPLNEELEPYAKDLLTKLAGILERDNEENGIVCLKLMTSLHKAYSGSLGGEVPRFVAFLKRVYGEMPGAVEREFGEAAKDAKEEAKDKDATAKDATAKEAEDTKDTAKDTKDTAKEAEDTVKEEDTAKDTANEETTATDPAKDDDKKDKDGDVEMEDAQEAKDATDDAKDAADDPKKATDDAKKDTDDAKKSTNDSKTSAKDSAKDTAEQGKDEAEDQQKDDKDEPMDDSGDKDDSKDDTDGKDDAEDDSGDEVAKKDISDASDLSEVNTSALPPASASFKVAAECPITLVSLYSSYRPQIESHIPEFVPLVIGLLRLQAPQQRAYHDTASGATVAGVSPLITASAPYRAAYGDLILAQVKAASFLAYVFIRRSAAAAMQPYQAEIAGLVVRLLQDCPAEMVAARRELLHATRHILSTDYRKLFAPCIDALFSDDALVGDGLTAHETLRPLAYSIVADFIHVDTGLTAPQIARSVAKYCGYLRDASLPPTVHVMSAKLLLNLLGRILKLDRADARQMMMEMVGAFAVRLLRWARAQIKGIAQAQIAQIPAQIAKAQMAKAQIVKAARERSARQRMMERTGRGYTAQTQIA